MKKSFVLDLNKCTGCQACQVACLVEKNSEPALSLRSIYNYNEERFPGKPFYHLSLACNHCIDAPCMKYCPALAYSRDPDFGAVLIDGDKCIGCRYCSWVCPYDAPKLNESTGTIEKCDFCVSRLSLGSGPACVTLCPTNALTTEDDREIEQNASVSGFPDAAIQPAIRLIPLEEGREEPRMAETPLSDELTAMLNTMPAATQQSKISLKNEWTLLFFSFTSALLSGFLGASLISSFEINTALFGALALLNMFVSTIHLGNKRKAYRAILNWRRSWLSREIIFYSLFTALSLCHLILDENIRIIGWLAGLSAILTLISIDKVYDCAQTLKKVSYHSARVLFSGLLFGALFSGQIPFAVLILVIKISLYLLRKWQLFKSFNIKNFIMSLARTLPVLFIPLAGFNQGMPVSLLWFVAIVIFAEFIDRLEFYMEFSIISPQSDIEMDLTTNLNKSRLNTRADYFTV